MKNRFYSLALIVAFLCCAASGTAATAVRIKGKLIDSVSRKPLDAAEVLLFGKDGPDPAYRTLSGADGSFGFSDVKDGEYSLLVRQIGYDLYSRRPVTLDASSPVLELGTIAMRPLEMELAGVEVVARKKQVVYRLDKRVIEASSSLLADGGSAVDILENTPSIRVDAEGEVAFRGSKGFKVYVDGKPSIFSGTQALEQIPAAHIENIEIITTPSARHDAGGDAGIVNIVTKKHFRDGFSGIVNLTGSTYLSRRADFLLSYQNKASRWFFGGNWSDLLRKSRFEQQKTTLVADTTTTSRSRGPRRSDGRDYALKAGWSYTLPTTSLSVELQGGYGGRLRKGDLDYAEKRSVGDAVFGQGDYYSRDDYDLHETYYQGTVAASHKFNDRGHTISAGFYLKYGGNAMEYFQSDLFDRNNERQQGHRAWEDEHRWTVQGNVDYVLPYGKSGRLEAGYQYFSYLEDGDYSMQFWNPAKKEFYWRDDIYNTFYFQHGINSLYAIVADSYERLDFQAGLRGEHTHRVLRSSIPGKNRTFNTLDLFPSAHVGYSFRGEHRIILSYSRRITRPELFFMEPYITYRDYYSAEIGNPDIRPEYIDSYELSYRKNIGGHTLSAALFHRSRRDKIERLRVPYEAGVTLDSMANVGHDYATGLEISGQLRLTRWWDVSLNGSVYRYQVKNQYKPDGSNETSTNYDIVWNNGFDILRNTRIQLDGNFVGPSVTTQGRTDAFWYVNLAVRQQLLKRKVSATLSFRDLFNSARYMSDISSAGLRSVTRIRPNFPLISLSLSYTFNNFKSKSPQSRTSHDLFEGTNH